MSSWNNFFDKATKAANWAFIIAIIYHIIVTSYLLYEAKQPSSNGVHLKIKEPKK